jgi:sarcosine/dimethylglycine N-methyltransferase
LERQRASLAGHVSEGYIDRMLAGLRAWVQAGKQGQLVWGIVQFKKAA